MNLGWLGLDFSISSFKFSFQFCEFFRFFSGFLDVNNDSNGERFISKELSVSLDKMCILI